MSRLAAGGRRSGQGSSTFYLNSAGVSLKSSSTCINLSFLAWADRGVGKDAPAFEARVLGHFDHECTKLRHQPSHLVPVLLRPQLIFFGKGLRYDGLFMRSRCRRFASLDCFVSQLASTRRYCNSHRKS